MIQVAQGVSSSRRCVMAEAPPAFGRELKSDRRGAEDAEALCLQSATTSDCSGSAADQD